MTPAQWLRNLQDIMIEYEKLFTDPSIAIGGPGMARSTIAARNKQGQFMPPENPPRGKPLVEVLANDTPDTPDTPEFSYK